MANAHTDQHRRIATAWAAATLTLAGYRLHAVGATAWDVERPDGSWAAVENWQELCRLAQEGR
jgi:hypothetical protein